MNNDLISRSALKKAIKSYADDQYAENEYLGECSIMNIIDNAPTVNISQGEWAKGFHEGFKVGSMLADAFNERPQGEWIIDGHHIHCSRCNEYICNTDREGNKIPDNFCPNCGSDMRGKTYEND